MSIISSCSMPQLHPITLTDWLCKLGEKAFLAWLQLHSWKSQECPEGKPFRLSLSLTQVTKLLKVGTTTFYEKILRPLWNYGLIDLRPSQGGQRGIQLVIYWYPYNQAEMSCLPLMQTRYYDEEEPVNTPSLPSSSESHPHPINNTPVSQAGNVPSNPPPGNDDTVLDADPSNPLPKKEKSSHSMLQEVPRIDLPDYIRKSIQSDYRLRSLEWEVADIYQQCKKDSRFTPDHFLQKAHTCIKYCPDPERFGPYLLKAIHNDWKKQPLPRKEKTASECPPDVPPWVWKQQHCPPESTAECTPEQKSILDDLLRQLGDIK